MFTSTPSGPIQSRILAAAAARFAETGYGGTSVRDIADAAACNVALISYHFGGKAGLWEAIQKKGFIRFEAAVADAEETGIKRLFNALEAVFRFFREAESAAALFCTLDRAAPGHGTWVARFDEAGIEALRSAATPVAPAPADAELFAVATWSTLVHLASTGAGDATREGMRAAAAGLAAKLLGVVASADAPVKASNQEPEVVHEPGGKDVGPVAHGAVAPKRRAFPAEPVDAFTIGEID